MGGHLAVDGLSKHFSVPGRPPTQAVSGLSLHVEAGEVLGLLGPNGAGKTTSLRLMATLLPPDRGTVRVCGVDALAQPLLARRLLGFVPAEAGLPPRLSPREVVTLFAELHGVPGNPEHAADRLLDRLGATSYRDQACGDLSTGMKRRVVLARALVHQPRVLLLDEPTDGLDIGGRREVLALLRSLADEQGCAVVLSSHIMSEVAAIADRYVVMASGTKRFDGGGAELLSTSGENTLDEAFLAMVRP